jgi:hypothetical protein
MVMAGVALSIRRWLRRTVPMEVRLRISLLRRGLRDRLQRRTFARERAGGDSFPYRLSSYELAIVDYPGQEQLAEAKRVNQRLLATDLDGAVIPPHDLFSFWALAHRPTRQRGFLEAAALKDGILDTDIGGATCLLSTVVFNALLLAGFDVEERRCHSVDSYGDHRYFELGRDATIEYGYIDLRMRNASTFPVQLRVVVSESAILAFTSAPLPAGFTAKIVVSDAVACAGGFSVTTTRRLCYPDGREVDTDLGRSCYRLPRAAMNSPR